MTKKIAKLSFIIGSCFIFLMNVALPVKAKALDYAPSLIQNDFQEPLVFDPESEVVTWEQLGQSESYLSGPYDSTAFSFGLPATWELQNGSQLNLYTSVNITAGVVDLSDTGGIDTNQTLTTEVLVGGRLIVLLNEIVLEEIPLTQVGDFLSEISIPLETFESKRSDGRMVLRFILDSDISCRSFYRVGVSIKSQSSIILPHDLILPDTSLENFPYPIYQDSFIPDSALLVIPDQPSETELQAALTIAAGFGNLSSGDLLLDMVTQGALTAEQQAANHLIFIGKNDSIPTELELPIEDSTGEIEVEGSGLDDGYIQMINSPWSRAYTILVASGKTDQGVTKASQAISSGILFPNQYPNVAVVQQVEQFAAPISQQLNQTLAELGYEEGSTISGSGTETVTYYFYIPFGWTISPDANFEMIFSHSALIDYDASGISVSVNGRSIGSVRMNDETASQSHNRTQILLPVSTIVPGRNRLSVSVSLVPRDECLPRGLRGLWVNIWPESIIHLPLVLNSPERILLLDLDSYPEPFIFDPSLDDTAFVLMRDHLETWRAAVQIAAYLGDRADGQIKTLSAFYSDSVPEDQLSNHNFLLIGHPSQMPIVEDMNYVLPAPFSPGSDLAEGNFGLVDFLIPSSSPMGYVELLPSPWNIDRVILAIFGNTEQGLEWATSAIIESKLRSRLSGNLAIISGQQVISYDTRNRVPSSTNYIPPQEPTLLAIAPDTNPPSSDYKPPAWILPVLIVIAVLFILVLVGVGIRNIMQTRASRKT
jgi:hypothetical protein